MAARGLFQHKFLTMLVGLLSVVGLLLLNPTAICAGEEGIPSIEYQVKSAFLRNFIYLVEWPEAAFAASDAPFNICVLGENPFAEALDLFQSDTCGSHPIRIRPCVALEGAAQCQLVYVADTKQWPVDTVLRQLARSPVLTVSDLPGFARQGGMIELFIREQRMFFEVNRDALARAGLIGSSKLLRLSRSAHDQGGSHGQ